MSTITIGVDLAKSVFSVCEVDAAGHVRRRQDLRRDAFGTNETPSGEARQPHAIHRQVHVLERQCVEQHHARCRPEPPQTKSFQQQIFR